MYDHVGTLFGKLHVHNIGFSSWAFFHLSFLSENVLGIEIKIGYFTSRHILIEESHENHVFL